MQLNLTDSNYIGYLIDVRTPEEWSGFQYDIGSAHGNTPGHPGYDGTNGAFLQDRVLNISYRLFDSSGARPINAATLLDALDDSVGETWTIYNVYGGFEGRHGSPSIYCPTGNCPGWVESWTGFPNGLPHVDNVSAGAYAPVPEPATPADAGKGLGL